ncbi:DUF3307 domain-containing protein [Amaricoccus macauensis]|uniref:DUF3307 domain-containing protein n=1 Tax=Amaricoccus macauensis TaxID=57001 RepID=UPI003C7E36E0
MIETVIALTLGHLLADFVFQTRWMVENKRRIGALSVHVAIVAAATWACLGLAPVPLVIGLIAGSHALLDALKARLGGPGVTSFLVDQAAHAVMIGLAATLQPEAFTAGLWANPALAPIAPALPVGMALAAGLIASVFAGGYAVKELMTSVEIEEAEQRLDMPKGGLFIGRLERLLIYMITLAGHVDAIGFLIAAKSVLRFNELSREKDRKVSEYVIIGTLASFAWGLAASQATVAALDLLRAPPPAP